MMNLLDEWFKIDLGEGAFYSVFGFAFVFAGIALLIVFFVLLGMVMKRLNARGKTKRTVPPAPAAAKLPSEEEGVPPEVVAAITAALTAYCEQENVQCDFVVRRIKKL